MQYNILLQVRCSTSVSDYCRSPEMKLPTRFSATRTSYHGQTDASSEALQGLIDRELQRDKCYIDTMIKLLVKEKNA